MDTAEVDYSGAALHCTCAFARRARNAHGVEFCSHIQQVMEDRRDLIEDLPVAHEVVLSYTPAPDFQPFAMKFTIGGFDNNGLRAVFMRNEQVGEIAPDACRADVVEMATPYLVDYYYKFPCKVCGLTLPRSTLDTDDGIREVVRLAVEIQHRGGECRSCQLLIPDI